MKVFQLIIAATLMVSTVADGHMEAEEPCDDDEYVPSKSGKKSKNGKGSKNYGTGKSGKTGEGKGGKMKVGKGGKTGGGGSKSSKYPDGGLPSLYVMTNSAHGNAVQMYRRDSANGEIEYLASFATGGVGGQAGDMDGQARVGDAAAAPLGASGSLTNVDNRCLLAVNAGSNNVASFYIQDNGYLVRKSCVDSKGGLPVSTSYRDWNDDYLVYVLNAGGKGHLAGFHLDSRTCEMEYIHDSVWVLQEGLDQPGDLPNVFASPSQVSFSPDNEHLVVNIKRPLDTEDNVQGHFVVYRVLETGCLDHPVMSESNGNTPWAFIFSPHQKLISTEYNGPDSDGASHVSSYMFGGADDCSTCDAEGGNLILDRTIPLENDEYETFMATKIAYSEVCDCAVTSNMLTVNPDLFMGTLSTVHVNKKGHLSLIDPLAAEVGMPLDSSFSRRGDFLYVLSGGGIGNDQPAIYVYGVDGECTLTEIGSIEDGLPTPDLTENGVVGLALYM